MYKKKIYTDIHVLYLILLCLIGNTMIVFANGEQIESVLVDRKNTKTETRLCSSESLTISMASPDDISSNDPDKVEPYFKYVHVLRMILVNIKQNENDMIELLYEYHAKNQTILKMINELEQDYHQHSPIWWYTRHCFLSSLINQALQTMDMKILIKMSLFLRDLCKQIKNLLGQKSNSPGSLTVYRCLKLPISNFEKLQQNNNFYVSFNSFLLATFDQEFENDVCSTFKQDNEILPVLIEIKIEGTPTNFTQFVLLNDSNSKKEILFSMNSIFRIISITKNRRNIWQVQMVGTNDTDSSLPLSFLLILLQISDDKDWHKLAHVMILMRQAKHAENLYKVLLKLVDVNDKKEIINLCNNLFLIKFKNGSYQEANFFAEKKLQVQQSFPVLNQLDIASTYATIGVINSKMGKLENALSFHRKALEIQEKILPSNHRDFIVTYDNIATVHSKMGNHLIALSFYQKALEIVEEVLPFYDLDRAINYNNIAGEYRFIGDYEKALGYFEKTIQIKEFLLRADDPELAFAYDNIAGVYQNMKQYDKALLFYEKSLKISEKVLRSNHPELAVTYNNIAILKYDMKDYANALALYEKAIEIAQTSHPINYHFIAELYIGIGMVYAVMEQFANALSFYETALEIQKLSLPEYHSDFIITYMRIGEVYYKTGKYSTALPYFERGLKIAEISLPDHEQLKILRRYIARIGKEL